MHLLDILHGDGEDAVQFHHDDSRQVGQGSQPAHLDGAGESIDERETPFGFEIDVVGEHLLVCGARLMVEIDDYPDATLVVDPIVQFAGDRYRNRIGDAVPVAVHARGLPPRLLSDFRGQWRHFWGDRRTYTGQEQESEHRKARPQHADAA